MKAATSERRTRLEELGRAVIHRRLQLGIGTRRAFADSSRLGYNTLTCVERGYPTRTATYTVIDVALDWPPGTCLEILAGHPPPPVNSTPTLDIEDILPRIPTRLLLREVERRICGAPTWRSRRIA